ncbi:DJ-1 family glyoxalase III [Porphyromonas macacae]|uniref:DJ-1 family glyoxalase III n=1 Tax=Porphyromonas macacae TaxID=28115 RepID=UPI0035A16C82
MKKAFIFLAPGFEETEAIGTIDVLKRGGVDIKIVSVTGDTFVESAHGVGIKADIYLPDVKVEEADALILPGGMPGAENLKKDMTVRSLVDAMYAKGGLVAAICAAPMVLGDLGLLKNKKATCYPGFESEMTGAVATGQPVEQDGNIITGKGPAFAYRFGLAILTYLRGNDVAEEVAQGMLIS